MIQLDSILCKIAPTLQSAYDYAGTLEHPAVVIPTEQGFIIVENALPNTNTRRTTKAELDRLRANAKQIFCPETNQVYANLRDAERATGASYQNISAVLHKRLSKTKGLHFQYVSELDNAVTNGEIEY